MNKQQAKIMALWLAAGTLAGVVDTICEQQPLAEADISKVEDEFVLLFKGLEQRAIRLEKKP